MSRKGKGNHEREVVTVEPSRCPKCGSTNRARYRQRAISEYFGGVGPGGGPCTHIVRRWTHCLDCGQHRIDRTYENWPEGAPEDA